MAKSPDTADTPAEAPEAAPEAAPAPEAQAAPEAAPTSFALSLDEWTRRKSTTRMSIEMLHGFRADELRAGRVSGTQEEFDARLAAFAVRPVR